jgi:hypothetical protein
VLVLNNEASPLLGLLVSEDKPITILRHACNCSPIERYNIPEEMFSVKLLLPRNPRDKLRNTFFGMTLNFIPKFLYSGPCGRTV